MNTNQLLAAKQWATIAHIDPQGRPYYTNKTGGALPVRITARAELIHRAGNSEPYFSICGEIINPRTKKDSPNHCLAGGQITEEMEHHFPQVAPLLRVHLSNMAGVPMHAAANAAYFAGLTTHGTFELRALAQHLRVDEYKAHTITEWVGHHYGYTPEAFDTLTTAAQAFEAAFEEHGLYDQWKDEAAEALALLNPTEHLARYAQAAMENA